MPTVAAIALGVVACSSGPTQPPIGAWVNLYALLEFMPVGEVAKVTETQVQLAVP